MQLPENYYHCFLGNGLDAVLIGPTGSMVSDKVGVDYCVWYKSDRYYPEDKLVKVAGRFPMEKPLEHAEGSGWYEIAPIGRSWYKLLHNGQALPLLASEQRFVPQDGTLYTKLDYGAVKGEAVTWMHATLPILVERYTFQQEVEFQAWMGAGVWVEDGWHTDPFRKLDMGDASVSPNGHYDLGETNGLMALRTDPVPTAFGSQGSDRWIQVRARTITKYFFITDNRQGPITTEVLDQAMALGYDALRAEHLAFWQQYFAVSNIRIPDPQYQAAYDASMYHFKAMQNPVSGGLPVNNLRRTWSSHIFWDSYFIQQALLEANHTHEALEQCRFFQRTSEQARRHAHDEFGCDGLKWDWEITHDGRKAYGVLLHMKFQIHNNGSYANEIWGYYEYTQDKVYLAEFYPILEGLACFFMQGIVTKTDRGYEIGYQVGVHESPQKVRNDGTNLAGTIAILRHYADAARILGHTDAFTEQCATVADGLMKTMDKLYNGRYFQASEDRDVINFSSITPIYPMRVIAPSESRAVSTTDAYIKRYEGVAFGTSATHRRSAWGAGVLGAILAWQHRGNLVWDVLEGARPTICNFGGMTEVMEHDQWNMQYFGTAGGAICIALHQMLLQIHGETIELFPAIPTTWDHAAFENLLVDGFSVSADWTKTALSWRVRNNAQVRLSRTVTYSHHSVQLVLAPGEESLGQWLL